MAVGSDFDPKKAKIFAKPKIRITDISLISNVDPPPHEKQCRTKYGKFEEENRAHIAIRNSVHIYHASFIGDLIIGVREDASTLEKPIPIGFFVMNIMILPLTRSVAEGRLDDFFLNDASQITIQ